MFHTILHRKVKIDQHEPRSESQVPLKGKQWTPGTSEGKTVPIPLAAPTVLLIWTIRW